MQMLYNEDMISEEQSFAPAAAGTYAVQTYGCQMNAHESEKIAGVLEGLGLAEAPEGSPPDVLVLNTCCIRDSAEQRIIGHIGTLKKQKAGRPDMVIAVVGCLTARESAAARLRRTFPFVDIVLGTADIDLLPSRIAEAMHLRSQMPLPAYGDSTVHRDGLVRAYVNAMYGCNNFCSYCIVPYVRGRERSRPVDDILREVNDLCAVGYREVMLLGQNVNSYQGGGERFADLLRAVADETPVSRIRFMTCHPKDLSPALIRAVKESQKICSHVHLPVQSGSDRILDSMNRKYTRAQYLDLVEALRDAVPEIALTTDVIVAYPGEEPEDFDDTMRLMEDVRFDAAYTFVYSPREGTRAAQLGGQVDRAERKRRIMELVELQNEITRQRNAARVGQVETVLVEGLSARGADMCGRTDGGRMVNFRGSEELIGQFVPVRITETRGATLVGEAEGIA